MMNKLIIPNTNANHMTELVIFMVGAFVVYWIIDYFVSKKRKKITEEAKEILKAYEDK